MDKERVKELRLKLREHLAKFGEEHSLAPEIKGAAIFTPSNVQFKLELSELDSKGQAQSPERTAFETNAHFYGLSKNDIDKEFQIGNTIYKITGLSIRKIKYPVLCNGSDGKLYKFHPSQVIKYLGRAEQ
ncbi:hypothetical protein C4577_02865 [Candidatus Parcubacteria bacterium]|nr:MAG: hypothetical protein C4577_02865 [Candidatus Parcubacteria bacterium]